MYRVTNMHEIFGAYEKQGYSKHFKADAQIFV